MYLGLVFSDARKAGQVRETLFLGDYRHLRLDALDLAETQLVDLVGGHVRGGAAVNVVLVALLAVRQRSHGERGAAVRSVFRAQKGSEGLVGGKDIGLDGGGDLLRQTLLVFRRDFRRIFLCRNQKGIGVDDALALNRQLLDQESHRHQVVFHAGAQHFRGLAEDARNLVQARNVVLIVLHRIKRNRQRQIRERQCGCRSAG